MRVEGDVHGLIEGSVTNPPYEGWIEIYGVNHVIESEIDHTGFPTGRRIHHPFVVERDIDRATPPLIECHRDRERLQVELRYFRIDPYGQEEHWFTVELERALIVRFMQMVPESRDEVGESLSYMEQLSLVYETIRYHAKRSGQCHHGGCYRLSGLPLNAGSL